MANMVDYVSWRGDIPIERGELNEIDALILAQLSYPAWERTEAAKQCLCLRELRDAFGKSRVSNGYTEQNDARLLELISGSARFGGVAIERLEAVLDESNGEQFAAVTFRLDEDTRYISFRGTDAMITGWREDCCLAFMKATPAQKRAAEYLTEECARVKGRLYIGGHSKGGNLAVYAASNCGSGIYDRLGAVYDFDGPGFGDKEDAVRMYGFLGGKLKNFRPESSVVGLLLYHPDLCTLIDSDKHGILQHDPYSWMVLGPRFVRAGKQTLSSRYIDSVMDKWLPELTDDEKQCFVYTIFDVLEAGESDEFRWKTWLKIIADPAPYISAIGQLPEGSGKKLKRVLTELARAIVAGIPEMLIQTDK